MEKLFLVTLLNDFRFKNHERSKKHKEKMTLLRAEMEEELGGEPEPGLFALNHMEDFPFLESD